MIPSKVLAKLTAFTCPPPLRQATTELRVSGRHRRRYLLYLLYVCVMTAAFVAAAVGADSSAGEASPYRPAFGERVCWFSRRRALMVLFAAPLVIVMVANVALFVASASIIRRTTQATAAMSCGPTKVSQRSDEVFRDYAAFKKVAGLPMRYFSLLKETVHPQKKMLN